MGFLGGGNNSYRAYSSNDPWQAANNPNSAQAGKNVQDQQGFLKLLQDRANGIGDPSVAQQELQKAANQTIGQEASAIGSVKGLNPALAAKMISENSANRLQDTAGQAAELRNREMQQSTGQYGNELTNIRNQQINENLGMEGINADITNKNAGHSGDAAAGAGQAAGAALAMLALAGGGDVPSSAPSSPSDKFAQYLAMSRKNGGGTSANNMALGAALGSGLKGLFSSSATKGAPQFSPTSFDYASMYGAPGGAGGGGGPLGSQDYANMYGAPSATEKTNMTDGGEVPGEATVAGDSPKNDTVPILASPDEVVIPRSKARDPEKAKEFVEELNKSREKKQQVGGYSKVLKAHEDLHHRLSQLEQMCYGGRAT